MLFEIVGSEDGAISQGSVMLVVPVTRKGQQGWLLVGKPSGTGKAVELLGKWGSWEATSWFMAGVHNFIWRLGL